MKKTIGILTFHRAKNYGAVLQAYSLCKFMQKYGACEIIDYKNNSIEEVYYSKKGLVPFIKKIAKKILRHKSEKAKSIRYARFNAFLNNEINISKKAYNKENISLCNSKYNVLIVGSDQVWNTQLTNCDYSYFLDFALDQLKIAYSCSFGNVNILRENSKNISTYLRKFNLITARELEGVDFINNLDSLNASFVCDPVFLSSKEDWIKLSNKSEMSFKEPYILVYEVANGTDLIDKALKYAKENKLNVYAINHCGKQYNYDGIIEISNLGPYDFLNILVKSNVVFTTSFHGMALSLILNKKFTYELSNDKNNKNSRLVTLAELFSVEDRELQKDNLDKPFNWEQINNIIKKLTEDASKKLNSVLGVDND